MRREYVHQELNQEVTSVGGYYVLVKEVCLPFRGREVLYLVGCGVVDSSCCGPGGCAYALVPGFVVDWKCQTSADGLAVSQVEPIRDEATRREVRGLIEERQPVLHHVIFQ